MTSPQPAAPDETLDTIGLCCPVPVWETDQPQTSTSGR